jgi:hypothetical protein
MEMKMALVESLEGLFWYEIVSEVDEFGDFMGRLVGCGSSELLNMEMVKEFK